MNKMMTGFIININCVLIILCELSPINIDSYSI